MPRRTRFQSPPPETGRAILCWYFIALLAAGLTAQEPITGAVAPDGTWYTRGGCTSRSGATLTRAIEGRPKKSWEFGVNGTLEGEPLVWGDRVFLSERMGVSHCRIHLLRLFDGRLLATSQQLESKTPLALCIWEDVLIGRLDGTRIQSWLVGGQGLVAGWSWSGGRDLPLSEPLMVGREIYVRQGSTIFRLEYGQKTPSWQHKGRHVGELALRDNRIHAVVHDGEGSAWLRQIDRRTGEKVQDILLGKHPVGTQHGAPTQIQVGGSVAWVHHAEPLVAPDGKLFPTSRIGIREGRFTDASPWFLLAPVTLAGTKTLGLAHLPGTGRIFFRQDGQDLMQLATENVNHRLVNETSAAVVAGNTVLLAGEAFNSDSTRILWRLPGPSGPMIPTRENILRIEDTRSIVAYHLGKTVEGDIPWTRDGAGRGAMILEDGSLFRGSLRVDTPGNRLIPGGSPSPHDLGSVWLAITDNGDILHWAPGGRGNHGISLLLQDKAEGRPHKEHDLPWRLLQRLPANAPTWLKTSLWQRVQPGNPEVRRNIQERIPKSMQPKIGDDNIDWLNMVVDLEASPLELVIPGVGNEKTRADRILERARSRWRKDLLGLTTRRLCLVTPIRQPDRVARLLAAGEQLCDVLEDIFSSKTSQEAVSPRMEIHLYGSREEYVKKSQEKGLHHASHTEGHYNAGEKRTHFHLENTHGPVGRLPVLIHELTHQWVQEKCPMHAPDEIRFDADLPGFWIAEGFATMVQEFEFDHLNRTCNTFSPAAGSLDVVAAAQDHQLISWDKLFTLTKADVASLSPDLSPDLLVPMNGFLILSRQHNPRSIFYQQAGAACHYLFHAENGRYRNRLLKYVSDQACGRGKNLPITRAFGLTDTELGARVRAFARRTIHGPR